ncbi:MAG: SurA N-terminal domain-containing protein [Bacteroidetes bacterium]|nr:SurA N-terminal domain-containing protein [Bacteroidota bacterium]
MGVMNYLRERMGKIVAIAIGLSLSLFILIDVLQKGSSLFGSDRDELGSVAGEKISYNDFNNQLKSQEEQFQQSGQNLTPQFTAYMQENTWNQMVNQVLLNKEVDKLGLTVTPDEKSEMIFGNNPDQTIVQNFGDPQTGKVDQNKLRQFVNNIKSAPADDPMVQKWNAFINQMGLNKIAQKFVALATNGMYVNSLDTKDDYEAKNRLVNFKYVTLDYASIPDNKVTLSDDDYKAYYADHKYKFNNKEELRSFDYVSVNGSATKEDSAAVKDQVEKLAPLFKSSTNDSLFVQQNAETKTPFAYRKKGQLGDPKLDSVMFNEPNGFVYGPYLSNGSYKIAKLIDARVGPDSVKASHILISAQGIGLDAALKRADSLKKLVQGGKSFADLAQTFSSDPGSAKKGGELGMFGRGIMAAPFEEAAFNGKKGDLVITTTQFGVHLIHIEDQKGSEKVAKVALVDKPITPSQKTQTVAYSKAQAFLGALANNTNFNAEAKKEGLTVKSANDFKALAASVQGIDDARAIVRWAYKSKVGDDGDQVYVVGDHYIVPVLTAIKPKGTLSLDDVKKQIEPDVRKAVKAKQLIAKIQAAESGSQTIDQVAQKLNLTATPVQNVVFANPNIPGQAVEYKVIGTMFGSKPNQLSKPIEGDHGVYVFSVMNFINPAPLGNSVTQRAQIAQTLLSRSQASIFESLKDKANVKDYRAKFL